MFNYGSNVLMWHCVDTIGIYWKIVFFPESECEWIGLLRTYVDSSRTTSQHVFDAQLGELRLRWDGPLGNRKSTIYGIFRIIITPRTLHLWIIITRYFSYEDNVHTLGSWIARYLSFHIQWLTLWGPLRIQEPRWVDFFKCKMHEQMRYTISAYTIYIHYMIYNIWDNNKNIYIYNTHRPRGLPKPRTA